METTTVTDCLVLKIEERDQVTEELDTTIYIIYDKRTHNYVVRGKRNDYKNIEACTYSFVCNYARDLVDFLSFIICKKNRWTYVLYNYDNLPYDSNEITYEFLKEDESNVYELTGYNNVKYNRKNLSTILRMLRNVFNYYN
jgi:hypothetical protein